MRVRVPFWLCVRMAAVTLLGLEGRALLLDLGPTTALHFIDGSIMSGAREILPQFAVALRMTVNWFPGLFLATWVGLEGTRRYLLIRKHQPQNKN